VNFQVKVTNLGNLKIGGSTHVDAKLNLYGVNTSTIYSKAELPIYGDAIKSEIYHPQANAFVAYCNGQQFIVRGNGDVWGETYITFFDSTLKYDKRFGTECRDISLCACGGWENRGYNM
jgi:calcineurin-like phosphoesterase family protein